MFLNQCGKSVEPLSRVGMAERQMQSGERRRLIRSAIGKFHRCQLQRLSSGQAKLNSPAEAHAGGDGMAAAICATLTPGFSVSCTMARFCSSLKRRRFDRPSAAYGVKRYLRRVQLAALLN